MKIVIAPQAFKGSISALEVATAIKKGVQKIVRNAETVLVPVADGGDGTLETLVDATGGKLHKSTVTGPIGEKVVAEWGALGNSKTAMIEMARTSGLALIGENQRDPRKTTTYGLGETIIDALDTGYRSFIVGIGGSATNDAGAGMAQALGVKLLSADGQNLPEGGAALAKLDRIDTSELDARANESTFAVACDVSNPLCGPEGASAVYGPQKGATPKVVDELDMALDNFALIVKRDIGKDIRCVPGSGAAGGLGGGMIAFLEGDLRPGVDIVLDAVSIDQHLNGADLVITGEGQLDFQTVYNKAPIGVAKLARKRGVPVVSISGSLGDGFTDVHEHGIHAAFAITNSPMSLEQASHNAAHLITTTVEQVLRLLKIGTTVFHSNS